MAKNDDWIPQDLPRQPVAGITGEDEDFPEDPFLQKSLGDLPSVEVPPSFLPNVMFQVYERHHREKIHMPSVFGIGFGLLLLSAVFFSWEVNDYAARNDLSSFGAALNHKTNQILLNFDGLASAMTGIVLASWQLVRGAVGMFFSDTPWPLQLLVVAGILAFVFMARKFLAGLK